MSNTNDNHRHAEFCLWVGKRLAECRSERTHKSAIEEYAFMQVRNKMIDLGWATAEHFRVPHITKGENS